VVCDSSLCSRYHATPHDMRCLLLQLSVVFCILPPAPTANLLFSGPAPAKHYLLQCCTCVTCRNPASHRTACRLCHL
jgi:hypothetical protein